MFRQVWYDKISGKSLIAVGMVAYLCLAILLWFTSDREIMVLGKNVTGLLHKVLRLWMIDYKSAPNLIVSLCFFAGALKMRPFHNKGVNYVAASVFAVYLVHETPLFKTFLWQEIFRVEMCCDLSVFQFLVYVMVVVLVFFSVVVLLDKVRERILTPLITNNKIYRVVCDKMDKLMLKE